MKSSKGTFDPKLVTYLCSSCF